MRSCRLIAREDLGEFKFSGTIRNHMKRSWGGARAGAGRPPRGPRSSAPHKRRPPLPPAYASSVRTGTRGDAQLSRAAIVHVTAHVAREVGSLRTAQARSAIERALARSRARADFRIVALAFERSRLDLIVEATDRLALARGMQGFQVSAARNLNAVTRRRGPVFRDR
jgi:hypothetical protein